MYKDRERLIDYVKEIPDKTFIIEIPKGLDPDMNLFDALQGEFHIIFAIQDINLAAKIKEHEFEFFWDYPIFTWYELDSVLAYDPCYLFLTAPLCFSLRNVREKTDTPIRLCANMANYDYLPREKGLLGPYVRPEDVKIYETWVNVLEFKTDDLEKERTYLHVYKDNGNWPGNLNLLLTNFNINVDNRLLPEEFGERRANCNQRCMMSTTCHYCQSAIMYAEALRNRYYEDKKASAKKDI
jgi:hypothetical protein